MTVPTYHRSTAATWRRLRTGIILAAPGCTDPLRLNATGALVWDLLQEPVDALSVSGRLALTFGLPKAEVARTVGLLLDDLVGSGAVVQR